MPTELADGLGVESLPRPLFGLPPMQGICPKEQMPIRPDLPHELKLRPWGRLRKTVARFHAGFSAPSKMLGGLGGQAASDFRPADFHVNQKDQVAEKKGKIFYVMNVFA